jgi:putative signal transducing protein
MKEPRLIVIYKAAGEVEAELIKGKLNNAGIPAIFDHEAGGTAFGLTINGWGEFRVLVPEDRLSEARMVIANSSRM